MNTRTIRMVSIKCRCKFVGEVCNNSTSNRDSHTEYIDEDEKLILHHTLESNV